MTDPAPERWISVTGEGEATVAPDLAVVSFAVTATREELTAAKDDVNERASAVLARLRELGVAEPDIVAPDLAIHPEYDYRKGQKLVGYRVQRQVTARVRDLEALAGILDGIVAAGADEVHGAQMVASDASAAEHEALRAAMRAARAKAEAIATEAGLSLGAVARVEEEPGPGIAPMPRFRAMGAIESADVPTEVAPGDLTITRHLRAWFTIG